MEVVQLLQLQGFWQHQVLGELAARAEGNIELEKGRATSIGQCIPVFLPGEPPFLTEKPGRPQSTGPQRVEHDQSNSVCIDTRFFSCGSSASVRIERERGAAAWLVGTLETPYVQGHGLPPL